MFLHVGNNRNIREKDIVGIFDADTATVSAVTRRYLSGAQKEGRIEASTEDIPKSFVLYRRGKTYAVCFSRLSTAALLGRAGSAGADGVGPRTK